MAPAIYLLNLPQSLPCLFLTPPPHPPSCLLPWRSNIHASTIISKWRGDSEKLVRVRSTADVPH